MTRTREAVLCPAYLDHFVPTTRHNDGVAAVGGEAHAGDPLCVALILQDILQGEKRIIIIK